MKPLHWIILVLTLAAAVWFVYRTREFQPRTEERLDLNWRFTLGDPAGASRPGYNDSEWRYVSIPHDWMIEQKAKPDNPSGMAGGFFEGGIAWYRKTFDLEEFGDASSYYLLFEGVYMNSDVYLNGEHLGRHVYGYSSFYYDISEVVRKDSLNVLAVRTDVSELPVDRWYGGAGIYRSVKLIAAQDVHIPVWGTLVTSTLDSTGKATMKAGVELVNKGRRGKRFEVRFDIVAPNGRLVGDEKVSHFVEGESVDTLYQNFTIEDPELWSPSSPLLYQVNCILSDGNRPMDRVGTAHGIRSVEFSPDRGFILNGEKLIMKGVCLHHDGGALGAGVPVESWERRLKILKEDLGVNALRLAHNPHAPEVLDLCDRMGFLVIDEMYDKWFKDWNSEGGSPAVEDHWQEELPAFVRRDRNHPSVVLWSVGNEVLEQLDDPVKGVQIYRNMMALVREHDPSRQVSCAMHPGNAGKHEVPSRMMHESPVVQYNYRTDSFAAWHKQYPDLVFIASETKAYATNTPEDFQRVDFSNNSWEDMEEFVAGHFIWAGIDYLGESAAWPDRGLRNGLLLTNGFIKPGAWYIASKYREDPMVKLTVKDSLLADSLNNSTSWQISWATAPLADHWTFKKDSTEKEVVIFSNCEKVDLYLNKEKLATLESSSFPDGVMRHKVPFSPGTLLARAYYEDEGGKTRYTTDTLITSSRPYALAMQPDKKQLRADSRDLLHITTGVVDSSGVLYPHGEQLVNYELDGPGNIKVIDNGDLADHTPVKSTSRKLYHGRHLLILQAGSEQGDLIIKASAEGLKPSSVKIKSRQP